MLKEFQIVLDEGSVGVHSLVRDALGKQSVLVA